MKDQANTNNKTLAAGKEFITVAENVNLYVTDIGVANHLF
ncbi:hypothetical protein M2273_000981 [Mucilaginibacter lappiensis]|jgi:hypothetical protein